MFRTIARAITPTKAERGAVFSALRMGGELFGIEGDPFLNVDHFRISGPTFPPHPHAGFSAVTYILPESANAMLNRDSLGDCSRIEPGGLHWTAAGSGLVHEEIPVPGKGMAEGMQIFIRQPVSQEIQPPLIQHVHADRVPIVSLEMGGQVRVLAGSYRTVTTSLIPPSPIDLLDLFLPVGASFEWQRPSAAGYRGDAGVDWNFSLYVFSGTIEVLDTNSVRSFGAPAAVVFASGTGSVAIAAVAEARVLLMAGRALQAPAFSNGPFVMSSREALADAALRHASGAMGRLPQTWPERAFARAAQ